MHTLLRVSIVLGLALAPVVGTAAAVSEDEIRELRSQIAALSARLSELEARAGVAAVPAGPPEPVAAAPAAPAPRGDHWTDRIELRGDFRYRWESIDVEGSDTRRRQRIRARPALIADVNDDLEVGFGLASGGDSPVSSNQTLGGGGSTKPINLDLAYFAWTGLENTSILGGKFKRPLRRVGDSSLVWDDDWRPEGLAATWDNGTFYGTALTTWLEADSRVGSERAYALQAGGNFGLGRDGSLTLSAGYYDLQVAGREAVYEEAEFFGNSFTADGRYLYDYQMAELAGEFGFALGDWPVSLFADYVKNLDADRFDTGWAVGGTIGKAKDRGSWRVRYVYQDLEADAVFGLLTDSNFGGGGTDARGHILSADYVIAKNWVFRLTYYDNVIGENAVERGDAGAAELDYDRLILDFRFKY
jgi:hypothetical protein